MSSNYIMLPVIAGTCPAGLPIMDFKPLTLDWERYELFLGTLSAAERARRIGALDTAVAEDGAWKIVLPLAEEIRVALAAVAQAP